MTAPLPFSTLPTLGVGASLSLETEPDPADLVRTPGGPCFIEYAGKASFEAVAPQVERVKAAGAPVLFHPSYLNFCGSFENAPLWLEETARHLERVGSAWLAQDCAYCFWGAHPGYSSQFGFFIPPLLNEASLERAKARVQEVQAKLHVPLAVEPPSFTFTVGSMPLLRFFGELSVSTGAAILLDAGHLVAYERATQRSLRDELSAFPAERVIELHIAGGRFEGEGDRALYVDAHARPILDETWDMFEALLPHLSGLRAVCFECEGVKKADVLHTLERVRRTVLAKSGSAALVAKVKEEQR